MEDLTGKFTNEDIERMRDELTALEMDMHVNGNDNRLKIKELKEKLKGHE